MKQVPATNPALSRTIQKLAVFRFDDIMRGLGLNTRVHIGPGTFETRGSPNYYDPARWQVQSGQRITGAGMGLTILRLQGAPPSPQGAYTSQGAIAAVDHLSGFELADLTIDCNLPGQPSADVECHGM